MTLTSRLLSAALVFALTAGASADSPEVQRTVGSDGVPVISIKSDKAVTVKPRPEPKVIAPKRKAFKVYDLDNETETASSQGPTVVVVGSPPPIAPNNNYGFGYGYGYQPRPFYGPGAFQNGFYQNGFIQGGFFQTGFGVRGGYWGHGRRACATHPAPANYQSPPLNYQNPPINYQNPPANYRPLNGFYTRTCR